MTASDEQQPVRDVEISIAVQFTCERAGRVRWRLELGGAVLGGRTVVAPEQSAHGAVAAAAQAALGRAVRLGVAAMETP